MVVIWVCLLRDWWLFAAGIAIVYGLCLVV